ncbi:MAG: RluA family pseudouridine synthase [Chitinophagaceae bacterium]
MKDWIIFKNDNFIVINKPSGLLSIPDRMGQEVSLKTMLQEVYGQVFTVHRLDKDTSGLILFALNEEAHKHFSQQFEARLTEKIYLGLVIGSPVLKEGHINACIAEHAFKKGLMMVHQKGKESLTDYKVLEDFGIYSWIQFQIHTGRTHQIRVHAKEIGHPIVCDELYGDAKPILLSSFKSKFKLSKNELEERPILGRLGLHAFQLKLRDMNNEMIELEAPLPKDLRATLQQLQKRKKV